jgi:hypothetical protein
MLLAKTVKAPEVSFKFTATATVRPLPYMQKSDVTVDNVTVSKRLGF